LLNTCVSNNPPTINAVGVTRERDTSANLTIANVTDPDQALNTMSVTVNNGASATVSGVTVSDITVDAMGVVKADVAAACGATDANFTLKVTDTSGEPAITTLSVTVTPETEPPVITPNGANPMTVECATGFSDPGATATDNCGVSVPVTITGTVNTGIPGAYTITYKAKDAANNETTKTRTVNVVDTTKPTLTLKSFPAPFPNDHKYRTLKIADMVASISDGCNTALSVNNVVIEKVTSDEPDDAPGGGDGNTTNDIVIAPGCKSVQLRAERDGDKNGRIYVVTLLVKDASGNTTRTDFKVSVPISQNGTPAVQDATAQTMTGGCP
jgi:hypothetical protein